MNKRRIFPQNFQNLFIKFTKKNISVKTTIVIIVLLLTIYLAFTIDEFDREEFELGDYNHVKEAAIDLDFEKVSPLNYVRFILLNFSYSIFENLKVIPFFASVSLLFITYFITLELTKSRICGLIAFSVVLQSNLFLIFDTTATYENFWTSFYFFSLYLILKKPFGSPVSFIMGLLSKALVVTMLPVNWYAIILKENSLSQKKFLYITYGVLTGAIVFLMFTENFTTYQIDFNFLNLVSGLNEFASSLRFENLILITFFPMLVLLYNKILKQDKNVSLIIAGILFSLLSQPLLYAIVDMSMQPYRYIPFIVFCAIGIAMIFSKSKTVD